MKYKLKESITKNMLEKEGYNFDYADEVLFKDTFIDNTVNETVIIDILNDYSIECLNYNRENIDCIHLIKDLIDLDYIEVIS